MDTLDPPLQDLFIQNEATNSSSSLTSSAEDFVWSGVMKCISMDSFKRALSFLRLGVGRDSRETARDSTINFEFVDRFYSDDKL